MVVLCYRNILQRGLVGSRGLVATTRTCIGAVVSSTSRPLSSSLLLSSSSIQPFVGKNLFRVSISTTFAPARPALLSSSLSLLINKITNRNINAIHTSNNNSYTIATAQRLYSSSTQTSAAAASANDNYDDDERQEQQREYKPNLLDAFRDPIDRAQRLQSNVGRSWSVQELRRKSYEDLHKLWYVLYKEKNMLLTEQQLSRRKQLIMPQLDRFKKVRKSMGAIKHVLGERKRVTVSNHLQRQKEKEGKQSESE